MTTADTTATLDVQGLSCPLPVLKANKALRGMALVGTEQRTLPRAATAERRRARLSFAPATTRRAPA